MTIGRGGTIHAAGPYTMKPKGKHAVRTIFLRYFVNDLIMYFIV